MSKMSLLELPPELLHWIFDYLDTRTILDSIRPICTELCAIVKTYNKLRLDISSSGIPDLTSIADFIQPNNVISLILADNNAIESSRLTLFFSLFQLDQFNQLQSLTLTEMKGTALYLFFQYIIARPLPLKLFSIKLCRRTTTTETQRIINLLSSTIEQFGLQNLHLNIVDAELIIADVFQPIQNALRHLIINKCTYRTYHVILCRCVHLRTLVIENCEFEGINQTVLPLFPHSSDSKLTSLTLNRWWLSIDKLKLILPLTPSLVHLKVIVGESRFRDMFDGDCWEQFIQNKLLLLKKFEFSFSYSERRTYDSLDSIITPFRTPFWLKDKHWIVICDFILSSSQIVLHTLPLKLNDSDIVIRCDALSSTNCYRLLTGYWLNHLEHDSREQTLTSLDISKMKINDLGAQYISNALENNPRLTTLRLENNALTARGMQYMANVLQKNKTLRTLSLVQTNICGDEASSLLNALKKNKTLTTINLGNNQIGASGASHLEDILRQNTKLMHFNIQNNRIGDQGVQSIVNALDKNTTLKSLSLEENGITYLGAKFLAERLINNTTLITLLDLQNNTIGDDGVKYFANVLKNNTTLTTLILAYNLIGTSGVKYLKDALRDNMTLTTLNLAGNSIDPEGAECLAEALRINKTLTTLILAYNPLGALGTKYLADALETNSTLTTIDLRANKIGPSGAKCLSDALQKNKTLRTLNLRGNDIGPSGCEYIADMLQTLITLILENNQIGDQGAEHLAKGLETNKTLKTLNLANNKIGTLGGQRIAEALKNNMAITTLDIEEKNSIDQSIIDVINAFLKRNQSFAPENVQ